MDKMGSMIANIKMNQSNIIQVVVQPLSDALTTQVLSCKHAKFFGVLHDAGDFD